jgi:hypothetical protein
LANEETMLRHTLSFALAIVTIALGVSCSSDSNEANNGAGAAGGAGGSSGSSGAAGSGGGAEDAGGVACGNERCMSDGTGEGCCLDQFASKCGIRRGSSCQEPPPPVDPRCPSVAVPVIGMLSSCCTPSGDCGINAPAGFGGGGCTELGEAQRQANMFTGGDGGFRFDAGAFGDAGFMFDGGFGITFPPPQKCDR